MGMTDLRRTRMYKVRYPGIVWCEGGDGILMRYCRLGHWNSVHGSGNALTGGDGLVTYGCCCSDCNTLRLTPVLLVFVLPLGLHGGRLTDGSVVGTDNPRTQ